MFPLSPRCRLKLGKLFQNAGEQFGRLITSVGGLDGLDCLPEYFFSLGLLTKPSSSRGDKSELCRQKGGNNRCRFMDIV
jgi:hypothetical protein